MGAYFSVRTYQKLAYLVLTARINTNSSFSTFLWCAFVIFQPARGIYRAAQDEYKVTVYFPFRPLECSSPHPFLVSPAFLLSLISNNVMFTLLHLEPWLMMSYSVYQKVQIIQTTWFETKIIQGSIMCLLVRTPQSLLLIKHLRL